MGKDYFSEAVRKHREWAGKLEVRVRVPLENMEDLSYAYTPGVAAPCLEINKNPSSSFELTRRSNTVAVITDGTAVLGLGDIGPEAGMPVMEGKCAIFKCFAGIDAIPLCLKTKDTDEIVRIIHMLSGSFGGINLEDIASPRCFEIEEKLRKLCDIPVFHDDQHGTAIVTGAALLNALRLTDRKLDGVNIAINGAGAAGISIAELLFDLGAKNITMAASAGILCDGDKMKNPAHAKIAKRTNRAGLRGSLADAMKGADVFIGVSVANVVTKEMVKSMAANPVVLAMANPVPEISMQAAIEAGAAVVGTGSSAEPNQVNNALIFPGIFRGALDSGAKDINMEMRIAACHALAGIISDGELKPDYIIPSVFDARVVPAVAEATKKAAVESKICR